MFYSWHFFLCLYKETLSHMSNFILTTLFFKLIFDSYLDYSDHSYFDYKSWQTIFNWLFSFYFSACFLFKSSRPEVFWRKGVLGYFTKFAVKHLYQALIFDKVTGLRPANLLKRRLWHRFFSYEFCEISKNIFFHRTPLVAASIYFKKRFLWFGLQTNKLF